jgi:hypothetical protein
MAINVAGCRDITMTENPAPEEVVYEIRINA